MYKEELLDKENRRKFILLKSLYLSSNPVSKSKLCTVLNVTKPTLARIVSDIQESIGEESSFLQINKDTIELQNIEKFNLGQFFDLFVRSSLPYQLVILLYRQREINYVQVYLDWNISSSTLQKAIYQCNRILETYGLRISRGRLEGDIKQKVFFYYAFHWVCEDANDLNIQADSFYLFEKIVFSSLDQYEKIHYIQRQKLSVWLSLSSHFVKQMNQTHEMDIPLFDFSLLFSEKSLLEIQEILKVTKKKRNQLINLIFLGLLSLEMVSYDFAYLMTQYKETRCFEVTNRLFSVLGLFYEVPLSMTRILKLKKDIVSLLVRVTYFKGADCLSMDETTIRYIYQEKITGYRKKICEILLDQVKQTIPKKFTDHEWNYLFFMFLCVIANLKLKEQFCVRIALLLKTPALVLDATIPSFERRLNEKYGAKILEYSLQEQYDLVITNFDWGQSQMAPNFRVFYQVMNIDIAYDQEKIGMILEQLIDQKCQLTYSRFLEKQTNEE